MVRLNAFVPVNIETARAATKILENFMPMSAADVCRQLYRNERPASDREMQQNKAAPGLQCTTEPFVKEVSTR
jgi:hypothetical protein